MRKTFLIMMTAAALLSGCAWETYQDGSGKTTVRQKISCRHARLLPRRQLLEKYELQPIPPRTPCRTARPNRQQRRRRVPPTLAKTKVSKPINLPYAV
ncbi:hypothetical protein NEIPOLOT_01979 [Neisseria polysaccharea ATCC 43768]|nr:hypothetical protein NEIPOLOT_01979 [Neisseria polysaccharea ATCC 43768]